MALLTILHHPDPRLREKALPVETFDDALQTLIDDMFETMYDAPGVGLAATQVGVAKRIAVMDCSGDKATPEQIVIINPEIVDSSDLETMEEGCLSVPGVGDKVQRYNHVVMRAQDRHGNPFELEAEGLLAQAIQHEIDHLNGTLYLDRLSSLKRDRLLKKLRKMQAE